MAFFLAIFLGIYGGMHAYVFWRFFAAVPQWGRYRFLTLPFLFVMVLAPIFVRLLERRGLTGSARWIAALGFTWMAVVFWMFMYCAVADLWTSGCWGIGQFWPKVKVAMIPAPWRLAGPALVTMLCLVWSSFEVRSLQVTQLEVEVPSLPVGYSSVKLMFISDVHLGLQVGEGKLAQIRAVALEEQPDMILCGGDLADGTSDHLEQFEPMLKELHAPMGKYAVLGNHEFYIGLQNSLKFFKDSGFRTLRGEGVLVGEKILIAGVDDPAARRFNDLRGLDEDAALEPAGADTTVILLKHQPDLREESLGRFDLQLSGHTHGGQIVPFNLFVRLAHKHSRGLVDIPGRGQLYVSRGTGTWGPKLRFLSPPEVTIITLVPAPKRGDSAQ